ncbi:hypothetical protein DL769_000699 [Monosporascus sp. CRB-8-3]|nr:hypothetical protein DL769_000699 [Monosporascus sp. CRB-8-3]
MGMYNKGIIVDISFPDIPIVYISFTKSIVADIPIPIAIVHVSFTNICVADISSRDASIIDVSVPNFDIVNISIGNASVVDAFFTDTTLVDISFPNTSIMPPVKVKKTPARELAYPYPSMGLNSSGKAATKQPQKTQQSTSKPGSSHGQGSSAGESKPKEAPKMLVCVNCKKKYNPDTVQFGSCRMHKDKYGRAYPDQVPMDHWRNSAGDDQGKDMWLCCGNEDKNHPGCMEWVHCQK